MLRISRLNGWSVALFAGVCTLITALFGDLTGVLVGLMVVASGIMEVRGYRLLCRRQTEGMQWLIRAQLFLLSVILIYSATRMMSLGRELAVENLSQEMRDLLKQLELNLDEIKSLVQRLVWAFYGAVMLTSCLYQGGLAFYYSRKQALVAQALDTPATSASDHPS